MYFVIGSHVYAITFFGAKKFFDPFAREIPTRVQVEKSSCGQAFSGPSTMVDPERTLAVNFSYQGRLVQTYNDVMGPMKNVLESVGLIESYLTRSSFFGSRSKVQTENRVIPRLQAGK